MFDRTQMARSIQGGTSRRGYFVSFETQPIESRPGVRLPDHSGVPPFVCSLLSILFGKRFDSHGLTEGSGFFHMPDLSNFDEVSIPTLPQNTEQPRSDYGVPLNLTEISRISSMLYERGVNERFWSIFRTAAKFYWQALRVAEHEPETAYLHLITVGELLAGYGDFADDLLLDDDTLMLLQEIVDSSRNGLELARRVRLRFRQIKRAFVESICSLVDPLFFERTEAQQAHTKLGSESFRQRVAAAYDLRSRYVHTGIAFGRWIAPSWNVEEVQWGMPVVSDKSFGKILHLAPTYAGLERIMRYSLLRFAEKYGVLSSSPPGKSPEGQAAE